jgi:diacylglycerol kinase (ATP)
MKAMKTMRTKPEYTLYKNASYALAGLCDMLRHESSFRLEVLVVSLMQLGLFFVDFPFIHLAILRLSLFLPLIAEAINSAIERTVDLVTIDFYPLAKQAKDLGSSVVFLSITLTTLIWGCTLYSVFGAR